jgi:subtilisin family serine protease
MRLDLDTSGARPLIPRIAFLLLIPFLLYAAAALAKPAGDDGDKRQRYIVELRDPPLALYDGRELAAPTRDGEWRLAPTTTAQTGKVRLDPRAPEARAYLDYLEGRQVDFRRAAEALLGRALFPAHVYRNATNGMAVDLTATEAALLERSPLLQSIRPDREYRLETDAGPPWIGADDLWDGAAGYPAARGEGIVVGVIDSGINWDHPAFADPSLDGYDHENPLGEQLGLCSDPEVLCNDKLIGVWDFIEDDPDTEENEYTKGRDDDPVGHGSHAASIAVGNRVNVFNNGANINLSGVAPRANLITYRVCYDGRCPNSAMLAAIDQAVDDGVDVINVSLGSDPDDPWAIGSDSRVYLAARGAGILPVTSAGNSGPGAGSVGAPGNAPWMVAVGYATHDRIYALGFDLIDGPEGLACVEGNGPPLEADFGPAPVVYAGDVGDPLGCSAFPAGSMAGAIALISRGACLFADKVANAEAAGAEFMVVFNNVPGLPVSMALGDSEISSCMISNAQGVAAVDFVQSSPAPSGRVNYPEDRLTNPEFADRLADSSSRGPALPPVADTLKPNLIAPGTQILAASNEGQAYTPLSGSSFSSPHVAGAAALLKSVHRDWGPSQLASALETTATAALARNSDGSTADPHQRGSGRPVLADAVNAGLYLDAPVASFHNANPASGGQPRDLNLPGLVDSACQGACGFARRVTDLMGGGSWTATPMDFPAGVDVAVTPAQFTLGNRDSNELAIDIDLAGSGLVGEWVFGRVRLSAAGSSDQYLTVAVYSDGGDLPASWDFSTDLDGGSRGFGLVGLVAMPDATFQSGGLQPPDRRVETLPMDPTPDDPYDSDAGTFTRWYELPRGALWLTAETLPSTAGDIDLYVGRDDDQDGFPDADEELCSSTTSEDVELCDLYDLGPGDYWIRVQNWEAGDTGLDEITLLSAAIEESADSRLAVSGPGIVAEGVGVDLRLSWDNLAAVPGEEWLGAVGIGTRREQPNNIGVIPVRVSRSGIAAAATTPLFDGRTQALALGAGGTHDRVFIDVPAGAASLEISASALDAGLNDGLTIELKRLEFDAALADPPFAVAPGGAQVVARATGSGGVGPTVSVSGSSLQAGRWYVVLSNDNDDPAGVELRAEVSFGGTPQPMYRGLWAPTSRPDLRQGYDYNWGGSDRALIWYSYDEFGQPAWYIAGSPEPQGDIWVSDLFRVTNDGSRQQLAAVGTVAVTRLSEGDQLFSFTLFGASGTDRMGPLAAPTCPQVGGSQQSYTGIWYRGVAGLGGASVIVNDATQAQIHYLFDGAGRPRWLVAQDLVNSAPTEPELPMLQFQGYCAVCEAEPVTSGEVGVLERSFASETAGSWTLDYLFEAPLSGGVQRTDSIVKLTDTLACSR